jgi:hypothetical protein
MELGKKCEDDTRGQTDKEKRDQTVSSAIGMVLREDFPGEICI